MIRPSRRKVLLAAVTAVALAAAACGRDSEDAGAQQGEEVAAGKASGEITGSGRPPRSRPSKRCQSPDASG